MPELTAKRTLVKSPPELWEELSEVERLAKHLGAFGEIKITRLDPEHTVAWEGEHASGTVSIEPSGWGTKVTLSAELAASGGPPEAEERVPEIEGPVAKTEEPAAEVAAPAVEPVEPAVEPVGRAVETVGPAVEPVEPAVEPVEPAHDEEPLAPVATPEPAEPAVQPTFGQAPRRRRGFWARLFSGWLVPEERLHPTASTPRRWEDFLEGPSAATPDQVPEEPAPEEPKVEIEAAASEPVGEEPAPEPEPITAEPEPIAAEPEPTAAEPKPIAVEPSEDEPVEQSPGAIDHEHAQSVLVATLDALGSAHHRPYSRG
jgi:hypothetical protein